MKQLEPHDVVVNEVASRLELAGLPDAAKLLRRTLSRTGSDREMLFDVVAAQAPAELEPAVGHLRARETWDAAQALVRVDGTDILPWDYIVVLAHAQGGEVEPSRPVTELAPEPAVVRSLRARVAHLEALLEQLAPQWRKSPAEEAAAFNRRAPVGTRVRYWRGVRQGPPSGEGSVRYEAHARGDRAAVWITGCSGWIALSHVEVVS